MKRKKKLSIVNIAGFVNLLQLHSHPFQLMFCFAYIEVEMFTEMIFS